ncbi:unnamed protein product [Rotaria sp. Silwood2]|nr:unnamed protein product [Rotaria sp. Silwood2]CAF4314674.1 unnamed protein product [Rotaria sp. Silwood2]
MAKTSTGKTLAFVLQMFHQIKYQQSLEDDDDDPIAITQLHCDELMKHLMSNSYSCMSLNSDINIYDPDSIILDFKSGESEVLDVGVVIFTNILSSPDCVKNKTEGLHV